MRLPTGGFRAFKVDADGGVVLRLGVQGGFRAHVSRVFGALIWDRLKSGKAQFEPRLKRLPTRATPPLLGDAAHDAAAGLGPTCGTAPESSPRPAPSTLESGSPTDPPPVSASPPGPPAPPTDPPPVDRARGLRPRRRIHRPSRPRLRGLRPRRRIHRPSRPRPRGLRPRRPTRARRWRGDSEATAPSRRESLGPTARRYQATARLRRRASPRPRSGSLPRTRRGSTRSLRGESPRETAIRPP